MSVPKRAAQKMGQNTEMFGKRKKLKHRERSQKKKCKEKKERTKVERENVDSLTLGHNVTEWVAATTAAASS